MFLGEPCFRWLISLFLWTRSLQYKAERLGWSGSLLLQTEAALISDYGTEQIDYRYVLYMTPLQKTPTIPLIPCCELGLHRWSQYDHSHIQITRRYNRLIKRWNMWQTESWCGCRRQILFSTWKNVFVWFRTQHRSHDQTSKCLFS